MGVVDATYKYFSDEKIPLSRKVKLTILVVVAAMLIDNHYGFSHTVINSYRVDYMMKLESVKQEYKHDARLVSEVDKLIETEHNRKGAVEKFYSLLTPKVEEKQMHNAETAYNTIINERDPIIHTITGSFIPLMLMLGALLGMVISIFNPESRSFDTFFWATIIVIVSAIVTYYVALAWALIAPICGIVLINYIIQAVANLMLLVLFAACLRRDDHKKEKIENDVEEFEILDVKYMN